MMMTMIFIYLFIDRFSFNANLATYSTAFT